MPKHTLKRPSCQLPDGTIELQLTKGYKAYISPDQRELAQWNWNTKETQRNIYAECRLTRFEDNRKVSLHVLIMERVLGRRLNEKEQVDHIDGDGLNCRTDNLRLATNQQNQQNRRTNKRSKSGLKGAFWSRDKRKWKSEIHENNVATHLGYFDTSEAAHDAYCKAAIERFGEFARFE